MEKPPATTPDAARPARYTGTRTAPPALATTSRQRSSPFTALWLAFMRVRSGWRILVAVAIDVLFAVTLICAVPLYTNLFAAIELHAQLARQPSGGTNVDVTISHTQLSPDTRQREGQTVVSLAHRTLDLFAPTAPANFLVAAPLRLFGINESPPTNFTQLQYMAYDPDHLAPHIHLVAGSALPTSDASADLPSALVTQQMAVVDGVRVGDLLTVYNSTFDDTQAVTVRVAGVWLPKDVADPFWNGRSFVTNPPNDATPFIFPVLLQPTAFTAALGQLPSAVVTQHWTFFTENRAITLPEMSAVVAALQHFRTGLSAALAHTPYIASILTITGLDKILAAVAAQQQRVALAFNCVGVFVLGIALVLLAVVVHVFIDRDRARLATSRFRGASALQLTGAYSILTAIVGTLATMVGVLLALWLAPEIVLRFVSPSALPGSTTASAYVAREIHPEQVIVPALLALLLAVLICCWTIWSTLRTSIQALAAPTASSKRAPFWQRLYLDVFLAVLGAVGYLELTYYNDAAGAFGRSSPLLIAVPLLLLLAGAMLLLRLFPVAAGFWAQMANRSRGATWLLSSRQVTQGRTQATLQPLMAMLAIGIVALAVAYDANAQQNAALQATHQTGADLRLVQQTPETPAADAQIRAQLARLPGTPQVTSAYRGYVYTQVYWNIAGAALDAVEALAIDPRTWGDVGAAAWQPSYSGVPLATLLSEMQRHEPSSPDAQAHAGTADAPIWAIVSRSFAKAQGRKIGETFRMVLPNVSASFSYFVVGAIVDDFPTLDAAHVPSGFIVTDQRTLFAAMTAQGDLNDAAVGPNEYWLQSRMGGEMGDLLAAVERQQAALGVATVVSRSALEDAILSIPSLVGMRVLLIFGAIAIGLLTLFAVGLQTTLDARQRRRQLMALRALGVSRLQIAGMLLGERWFATVFGAVGGILLGWLVTVLTLPYLAVDTAATNALGGGSRATALLAHPAGNGYALGRVHDDAHHGHRIGTHQFQSADET